MRKTLPNGEKLVSKLVRAEQPCNRCNRQVATFFGDNISPDHAPQFRMWRLETLTPELAKNALICTACAEGLERGDAKKDVAFNCPGCSKYFSGPTHEHVDAQFKAHREEGRCNGMAPKTPGPLIEFEADDVNDRLHVKISGTARPAIRAAVQEFAQHMEARLRDVGDKMPNDWQDLKPLAMIDRLQHNLATVIATGAVYTQHQLADVANFAMMLFWHAQGRRFGPRGWSTDEVKPFDFDQEMPLTQDPRPKTQDPASPMPVPVAALLALMDGWMIGPEYKHADAPDPAHIVCIDRPYLDEFDAAIRAVQDFYNPPPVVVQSTIHNPQSTIAQPKTRSKKTHRKTKRGAR